MTHAIGDLRRTGSTPGLATGSNYSSFVCVTNDAAVTVEAAGYFNASRAYLAVGDVIEARMAMGGTPVGKHYILTAVPASGNVTVAAFT